MAEDDTETAGEIDALRGALARLETRLEAFEQWRALRQLDEREKNGQPLEGIDGVLFRGRLVQSLAQSSRDWRAYVRIEEAIGHLCGPMRIEQGILKEAAGFSIRPQAAAMVPRALPLVTAGQHPAPDPAAIPAGKAAEPDAPSDNAAAAHVDSQRLRVKIRAGSLQVLMPPSTSIQAIVGSPSASTPPATSVGATLPPVAALRPRPVLQIDEAEGLTAARPETGPLDPQSPRSVLQRIRVVSKSAAPLSRAAIGSNPSGFQVPNAAALLQSEGEPPPVLTGAALQSMTEKIELPGTSPAIVPSAGGNPPAPARNVPAGAEPGQTRLDALEAQLEQLIDKSASWPHPLDAARGASHTATPMALEPDTAGELDVDEAEVTIVRLAKSEVVLHLHPGTREEQAPPRHPQVMPEAAEPANSVVSEGPDQNLNQDDYAGYRLDLEEASVEIIVLDPASNNARDEIVRHHGEAASKT